jgi:hypothetical protein
MHPVISNEPEWRSLQEQHEANRAQRARDDAKVRQAKAALHKARQAWQKAADEAYERGEMPPPEPQIRGLDPAGMLHRFYAEEDRLKEAERRFLTKHADRLEARLAHREAELRAEASRLIDALDGIVSETGAVVDAARRIRQAARPGALTDLPDGVDVVSLIEAVRSSSSVLRPSAAAWNLQTVTPMRLTADEIDYGSIRTDTVDLDA